MAANWWVKVRTDLVSFAAGVCEWSAVPRRTLPPRKESICLSEGRRSYSYAVSENNISCKSSEIPLLMLPPKKDSISFLDLLSRGRDLQVKLPDDDPYSGRYLCGRYFSSRGWLLKIIAVVNYTNVMTLLHPFSKLQLQLQLPSVDSLVATPCDDNWYCLEGCFITFILTKFVLSSSNPDSFQALLIYGRDGNLGYARPGDQVWRKINTFNSKNFVDAIYYQNQFYAINSSSQIFVIKDDDNTATQIAELPPTESNVDELDVVETFYMVETDDGAMLVVSRRGELAPPTYQGLEEESCFRTLGFHVYEVDLRSNKWTRINSLGNRSLFLGFNSSFSVDASDNSGCKPNCIYFTDDFVESYWYLDDTQYVESGGKDTGIYNMGDGSIEPFFKDSPCHPFNPLMWVEQSS